MRIHQVDAFTAVPFRGNPAAVCVLDETDTRRHDAEWMQRVAREMNLSETAFVVPAPTPERRRFSLRWFTPAVEVDLCGHATLAAAHVLWETGALSLDDAAVFDTASGELRAELEPSTGRRSAASSTSGEGRWIAMDFPAWPPREWSEPPQPLLDAFGPAPHWVGRNQRDAFVVMRSADEVRGVHVRFDRLGEIDVLGAIVTAPADDAVHVGERDGGERVDYVSRFFAPRAGIDEDPVTGSAHAALGPYWSDRLGASTLVGEQLSERRGIVRTTVRGDRVEVAGQAVTTMVGTLLA